MIRAHLTFYTGFTVSFVLIFALSISQRLLVVVGGILGAGITYSQLRPLKRITRTKYVDFDQHRLVSINDEELECIFPKDARCGNIIKSPCLIEFWTFRKSVSDCKQPEVLVSHLRHMVQLKLCKRCQENSCKEKCVKAYVDKWTAEVKHELCIQITPALEERWNLTIAINALRIWIFVRSNMTHEKRYDEAIKKGDESSFADHLGLGKPPTEPGEVERHLPGAYRDNPPSELSPSAVPRGRRTHSGQRKAPGPEDQPTSVVTSTPACNIPQAALPDPLSSSVQQHNPPNTPSPQQERLPSSTLTMPTTPTKPKDGWHLVKYEVNDPETLHHRIFLPLQKKEVKSGYIYILRRKDDEEYYKVGFTTTTVPTRLAGHNKKCQGTWVVAWKTGKLIKHAKRVEKLIHLECEVRGTRYRESWCQTGGKCKGQHKEIIKATLEEVRKFVKHWVDWMDNYDRYVEVPNDQSALLSRRTSTKADPVIVWPLKFSDDMTNHNDKDEFYLMSTGETWWKAPRQQRKKMRSISTSALLTPTRPAVLEDTRVTQSDPPATKKTLRFETLRIPDVSTPSRRSSVSIKSSGKDNLGRKQGARGTHIISDDNGLDDEVQDDNCNDRGDDEDPYFSGESQRAIAS